MADEAASFDRLIEEVEAVDTLLDDGPGDDSAAFLTSIQEGAKAAYDTAMELTVDNVDVEFTDDEV